MDIMVTFPADPAEMEAVCARAAQLHAEAIRAELGALTWPSEGKKALLRQLILEKKGESGSNFGKS